MKRTTIATIHLAVILASLVFAVQPGILATASSIDPNAPFIAPETVDDTQPTNSDGLEYFGTDPITSDALEVTEPSGSTVPHRDAAPPPTSGIVARPLGQQGNPGNPSCMLFYEVTLVRESSVVLPQFFSPTYPSTRVTAQNPAFSRVGFDFAFDGNGDQVLPRPGDAPVLPSSEWDTYPATLPSLTTLRQWTTSNNNVQYAELRNDQGTNYGVIPGETLYAIVYIGNRSWNEVLCDNTVADVPSGEDSTIRQAVSPLIPANTPGGTTLPQIDLGDGQDIIFESLELQMFDRTGAVSSPIILTPADFFSNYYTTTAFGAQQAVPLTFDSDVTPVPIGEQSYLQRRTVPGLLERRAQASDANLDDNQYRVAGDFLAVVEVQVPTDVDDYIEARVSGGEFRCTYYNGLPGEILATCPNTVLTADYTSWYVAPVTGPLLYQDGDTHPAGAAVPNYNPYNGTDPFQVVHTVGGEANREAGENVWFALAVKNKWGDIGADPSEIVKYVRTVNPVSTNITTPCSSGVDPGNSEGWYSSVVIDPITGPVLGSSTRLSYTDPDPGTSTQAGGTQWVGDMFLGEEDVVYCVFQRTLTTNPAGDFELNVEVDAISYNNPGNSQPNELETPLLGGRSFPVAPASIAVTKTVIDPLTGNPPRPATVRPGDVVTYEIVITNTGEVALDAIKFQDTLTDFRSFPDVILLPPSLLGTYTCPPGITCVDNVTTQVTYQVTDTDPDTITNLVIASGEIINTDIEITARDTAVVLQADSELPIFLSAVGNNSGLSSPIISGVNADTQLIYSMAYTNANPDGLAFQTIEFAPRPDIAGLFYPLLQNPGSILADLPNYPIVEVYSGGTLIIPRPDNLFEPNPTGIIDTVTWAYDIPPLPPIDQPWTDSTIVQEVVLEALREDGTTFRSRETLVTQIDNPAVNISVQVLDVLGNPFNEDTVLRGETLQFDIEVEYNNPNARCDVFVRQYLVNAQTGVQTLINGDIALDWPGAVNELPGVVAPTLVGVDPNQPFPSYTIPDNAPDPLIFAFEFDARNGCDPFFDDPALIDRALVGPYQLSSINIDTQLLVVTNAPGSTTPVNFGVYPNPSLAVAPEYQLLYRADNNGPAIPEIVDWTYCIQDSPKTNGENCADGGISMFDGFPPGDDFGVTGPFGDPSRIFTTDAARLDRVLFDLELGGNYPNPLVIQVTLRVTTTGDPTDAATIRTFAVLPLVSDDLNLTLDRLGRTDVVRGDHGVPINFAFENTGAVDLENLRVIILANPDPTNGVLPPPTANIQPNVPYKTCDFTGGGDILATLAPTDPANGTCLFDFKDSVPVAENTVTVRIMVLGTEAGTGRDVFDIRLVEFAVLPHLTVEKTGSVAVLNSQTIGYSLRVTNNSDFQHVDFNNQTGIADVFTPPPSNSTLCIVPDGTVVQAGDPEACGTGTVPRLLMAYFTGLQDIGNNTYRLPPSSGFTSSRGLVNYNLVPNGAHGENAYENVATFEGARQGNPSDPNDNSLVAGSDDHYVSVDCPIQFTYSVRPAGGSLGSDFFFTLGEEVTIFVQGRNVGTSPVQFDTFLDPRYQRDVDPSITNITFLQNVVNWFQPSGNPEPTAGFVDTGGFFNWEFNMRIDVDDVLNANAQEGIYRYSVGYTTQSGVPTSDGCSSSVARLNAPRPEDAPDQAATIVINITTPLRSIKTIDASLTPPPIIGQGTPIKYVFDVYNISETTDLRVLGVEDSLYDQDFNINTGTGLVVNFCDDPACTTTTDAPSGILWRYTPPIPNLRPVVSLDLLDPRIGPDYDEPGVDFPYVNYPTLSADGVPPYIFNQLDVTDVTGEVLTNRLSRLYNIFDATPSALNWLDLPTTPDEVQFALFVDHEVLVRNPLAVTEVVINPPDDIVSRPGEVEYFITVTNRSDQYPIFNVSLDIDALSNVVRELPICGNPGYVGVDLTLTPYVCLPQPYPMRLDPLESVSVIVRYTVDDASPGQILTAVQAFGEIFIDGALYPINPPADSLPVNVVTVEQSQLTLTHQVYADNTCTVPLINVTNPDRDKNNDDTPEVAVGESFYYGLNIFAGSNRTFDNVVVDINMFNGDTRLSDAANAQLAAIATAGTNPFVTFSSPGVVQITDNNDPNNAAEVSMCIPQPNGLTITNRQPDPLVIQGNISGSDGIEQTGFSTEDVAIPEDEVGEYVDKNLLIDVTDPNLFISKSSSPIAAFPGSIVRYTLTMTNLTSDEIFVNDVWDDNVGVGQEFFDYDNDGTPDPLEFWHPTNPGLSSIDFFDFQSQNGNGTGWSWLPGNEGIIPPNDSVTYIYLRTITELDPNPLWNTAAIVGFIDDPNGIIDVADQTRNALLISNSQLSVTKTATPTSTVLGNTISYRVDITNIGDTPVYDIIVWDDRFNLEYADDGNINTPEYDQLMPNTPPVVSILGGGEIDLGLPDDPLKIDLGQLGAPEDSLTILYTLPVPPKCIGWNGSPNEPYDSNTRTTPGNQSGTCIPFSDPVLDVIAIDPFVNTVYAVGLIDDGNGNLVYLEDVGSDDAVVDIINPNLRITKVPSASSAPIGSDLSYRITIDNVGSDDLRIDEVLDTPEPGVNLTVSPLTFLDCPLRANQTSTPPLSGNNLIGTDLIPFNSAAGVSVDNNNIQVNNTAVLPVGCSAEADIIIRIPNPLPEQTYTNFASVSAINLLTGDPLADVTSAEIEVNASGLEISKRGLNCDTASNGVNTPITPLVEDPTKVCTFVTQSGVGPLDPGARLITERSEGQDITYELLLINSGTSALTSLQIRDVMMSDYGSGLQPDATRIPNTETWTDFNGNVYNWVNGNLTIGVDSYRGRGDNTVCGVNDDPGTPDFDESYGCESNYFGRDQGPFGSDNVSTPDVDESYLFESGEEFARPDPGPVQIPAITYTLTVRLPDFDLDGDGRYINRATVVGTLYDPNNAGLPPTRNQASYSIEVNAATLLVDAYGCATNPDTSGNGTLEPGEIPNAQNCSNVILPGADVYYAYVLTANTSLELENILLTDSVRGAIPASDICWTWPSVPGIFSNNGQSATCVYARSLYNPIPLDVSDDPFTNFATVTFDIDPGTPPLIPGTPVTAQSTVRIAAGELLLTVDTCETIQYGLPNELLTFDISVDNVGSVFDIDRIEVFAPTSLVQPFNLAPGGQRTLPDALQVRVDPFNPFTTVDVQAVGYLQDGATPPNGEKLLTATFTCTVQRVSTADFVVTKQVVSGNFAQPGDTVRYRITLENTNPTLPISNLTVADALLESVPGNNWNTAWPSSLSPNTTIVREFDYVTDGFVDPLINTVTANGVLGTTPVSGIAQAQVNIAVDDLTMVIRAPGNVVAGNTITFTYEVCNRSPFDADPLNRNDYLLELLEDTDPSGTPLENVLGQPFVPNTIILEAQQCLTYTRDVPTTLADAGTIVTRAAAVEGCLIDYTVNPPACDPIAPTVSDAQTASVNVIAQPNDAGIPDLRLTGDRLGISIGETINYTVEIRNLNTVHDATVTIDPVSLPNNLFPPNNYVIGPLQIVQFTIPYGFSGSPDPLVAEVTIDYTMGNGITGSITRRLVTPVTDTPGATVLLDVQPLEPESTPGGTITYQYRVFNISPLPITDAYIYNPTFIPTQTPNNTPIFDPANCALTRPQDGWILGNFASTDPATVTRFVPTLFGGGFPRTGLLVCTVAPDVPAPSTIVHNVSVNLLDIGSGPQNPNQTIRDRVSVSQNIVPPLQISINQPAPASPGGVLLLEFVVENIGPATLNNVSIAAPVPDECVETNWTSQLPLQSDPSSLWAPNGTTVPAGAIVTATASCTLPDDIIADTATQGFFRYPVSGDVEVLLDGNLLDTADPIDVLVQRLLEFTFYPPANNPTLQFLRAGDPVQFGFLLRNIAPPGTPIEGIQYDIQINGLPNACQSIATFTSNGAPFVGTLPNNNDSVYITCTYTPPTAAHGIPIDIAFIGSHLVNGFRVLIPAANPLATPVVENINIDVQLYSGNQLTSQTIDDGQTVSYTLIVTNTGQTPLLGINFAQQLRDLTSGATISKQLSITGGFTSLTQLYDTVCQSPLAPGASCTLASPASANQLTFQPTTSDPAQFQVGITAEGIADSGSNFEVSDTAYWNGTIDRPVLELPGPESSTNSNSSGNIWVFRPEYLQVTPEIVDNGTQVTFTVTLGNAGSKNFSNLVLTGNVATGGTAGLQNVDTRNQALPAPLNFNLTQTTLAGGTTVNASANWIPEGLVFPATVNVNLRVQAVVDGGFYRPYDLQVTIPIELTNTAGVALDPNATDPLITKTVSTESAMPGDTVIWTVTATNLTTTPMTGVTITDNVPADLEITSANATLGASLINGQLVEVTIGPLDPGQAVTVTINSAVRLDTTNVPGTVTNVATVDHDGGTTQQAEAILTLGTSGTIPATGIGGVATVTTPNWAQRLPFAAAILGVFFLMVFSVGISGRQRLILMVLALFVIAILGGLVLMLAGDGGDEEVQRPSDLDGSPPPPDGGFPTATPVATEVAADVTPTLAPTVAPDALATIQSFPATATPYIVPTAAGPRRLDIPALNYSIPVPIVELPQINGDWDVTNLGHNVGWLDNTTWLDNTWGNTVLVAHIQLSDTDPGPFYDLNRVVPGDEIRVIEGNTVSYFEVTEIYTVSPTDIQVTHPTTDPMLTLITCTDWDENRGVFTDRLVVRAVPIPEVAAGQ